jgi:hypothetical protein
MDYRDMGATCQEESSHPPRMYPFRRRDIDKGSIPDAAVRIAVVLYATPVPQAVVRLPNEHHSVTNGSEGRRYQSSVFGGSRCSEYEVQNDEKRQSEN